MTKILIIDNYDSFTWNIYQYLCEVGAQVKVIEHDKLSLLDIEKLAPQGLVISPGPGRPEKAGISLDVVSYFADKLPIFGICLGHQVIAQYFGARLVRARRIMHGKSSMIFHDGKGIFTGISQFVTVVRYHSLIIEDVSLPDCFKVSAWSISNGIYDEIMAIRHRFFAIEGVQFHPESLLTEQGYQMLSNFVYLI